MAIYHLCIKIISRGKNKSAVADKNISYPNGKERLSSDRGNINREIKHPNMILREISRRIKALLNWIGGIGK